MSHRPRRLFASSLFSMLALIVLSGGVTLAQPACSSCQTTENACFNTAYQTEQRCFCDCDQRLQFMCC